MEERKLHYNDFMKAVESVKTREQAIDQIEGLYPTDSDYPDTNEKGKELLEQAKRTVIGNEWRGEPTSVLIEYARLCMKEDFTW